MAFKFTACVLLFLPIIALLTGHELTRNYPGLELKLGFGYQPEFTEPIENLTIAVARDATFRCFVHHLGGYRVGWVKADTKAIQAIHDHVITHNPRISVSHNDHTTWNLHIRNVQEEDRGQYMCQINTDPMKSQMGNLNVVVPPDFINEETSSDIDVPEGGTVKLTCRAKGHPDPHVQWRRENAQDIIIKDPSGQRTRVSSYQGDVMRLVKIGRSEMGAYMCIASNGIPPAISKRIMVTVNFHPAIQVPNQLVGAPLGTDVTLECYVEASPKAIMYWVKDPDGMVVTSTKYHVQVVSKSLFEERMTAVIRNLQKEDVGTYRCIAKNSLGEVESNIRIYEIPGPTKYRNPVDEDYYVEQFGSAETRGNDMSNNIPNRGSIIRINTGNPPRDIHNSVYHNYVPVDPPSNHHESHLKGSILRELLLLFIALFQIVYLYKAW